jgi:hypothetical protein
MGLQQKRDALDRCRVGSFASFGKTLFDQGRGVLQPGDGLAGSALAAKIVNQART